jgi:hypothetical protein
MINYKITNNKFSPSLNIFKWIFLIVRLVLGFLPMIWLYIFHNFLSKIVSVIYYPDFYRYNKKIFVMSD